MIKPAPKSKTIQLGKNIVLFIFVAGLLSGLAYLFFQLDQTRSTNEQLTITITDLEEKNSLQAEQINTLGAELGLSLDQIDNLQNLNQNLRDTNQQLSQEINEIEQAIEKADQGIQNFKYQIEESMAWFRNNSTLANYRQYDTLARQQENRCLTFDANSCQINISCLAYQNSNFAGFSYKPDEQTSDREDRLADLGQFFANQGGDCEDYALLAFAQLNYLTEKCRQRNADKIRYLAYQQSPNSKHYVENQKQYFLQDTADYLLPAEFRYFYPVCGSFPANFDPQAMAKETFGHCLLAFTKQPIRDSASIDQSLKGALLIENQTGEYLLDLNQDEIITLPSKTKIFPEENHLLFIVISHEDIFHFNAFGSHYQWYGLQDLLRQINSISQHLETIRP